MKLDIYQPVVTSWPCRHPALLEGFVAAQPGGLPSMRRVFINHRCPGAARGSALCTLLSCEGKQQTRKSDLQPRPSSPRTEGRARVTRKCSNRNDGAYLCWSWWPKYKTSNISSAGAWFWDIFDSQNQTIQVFASSRTTQTICLSFVPNFRCKGFLQ